MGLFGFERLYQEADRLAAPVAVAAMGADDPTVLEALHAARERGWIRPRLVGPEAEIRRVSQTCGIDLDGFEIIPAEGQAVAPAAVAEVRQGRAGLLMKGRIDTPALMLAVADPEHGLRSGRTVCQVVLMEIPRDDRRLLLADTGISVQPKPASRIDILRSVVDVAHALGSDVPRVAVMAATELVHLSMPETIEAAALQRRNEAGEFSDCVIQGPLSFDLAYAAEAGGKKRVGGAVVGSADALVFPNLLAANLTVKAIMYTADCRFGGVLRGTTAPVAFMSRADATATRLNSLALALRLLSWEGEVPSGPA